MWGVVEEEEVEELVSQKQDKEVCLTFIRGQTRIILQISNMHQQNWVMMRAVREESFCLVACGGE